MTLRASDIHGLIVYGSKLWGHAFPVPTNEADLVVTERAWADVLSDLHPEDVRAAMADWSGQYPPTPKQLRAATESLVRHLKGTPAIPSADQALSEVMHAVGAIGYVGTPSWSHAAVSEAVGSLGGWRRICEDENEPALRAHFMQVYAIVAKRARLDQDSPLPIIAQRRAELDGPRRLELDAFLPKLEAS